jgi:hypothetical protein
MECLSRKGLVVKALVINDSGDGAVPMDETKAALARFLPDATLAAIPRVKRPTDAADNFAALWRAIG